MATPIDIDHRGTEPMSERPYEKVATAKIFEKKRYTEQAIIREEREKDDLVKRWSRPTINNSWIYENEDYVAIDRHIEQLNKDLAEMNAELLRRSGEGRREGHRGPPKPPPITVECGCRPPRRMKLPPRVFDRGAIFCGVCSQGFYKVRPASR